MKGFCRQRLPRGLPLQQFGDLFSPQIVYDRLDPLRLSAPANKQSIACVDDDQVLDADSRDQFLGGADKGAMRIDRHDVTDDGIGVCILA